MVNRCICHATSFAEILERIKKGQTLDEIVAETRCGCGCGMCQPYIKLTILTNRSEHLPGAVEIDKKDIAEVDDPTDWQDAGRLSMVECQPSRVDVFRFRVPWPALQSERNYNDFRRISRRV